MSPDIAELLETFADLANHATGAADPEDQQLWYKFVVAAHRAGVKLDTIKLMRWLHEEAGFPEDVAFDLSQEYVSARQLLGYYDGSAAA